MIAFGNVIRTLGIVAFAIGLLASYAILMEVVTGFVGEGERLRPETEQQIQQRIIIIATLWVMVVAGWLAARIGTAIAEPGSLPPVSLSRLAAESCWVAAGIGLAAELLFQMSPRGQAHMPADEYCRLVHGSAAAGAVLLCTGSSIWRLRVRPAR
jgi:hypothetical protein